MDEDIIITTSSVDNKTKSTKGWKIATIVASVLAVCGIGFGVYGMVQSIQKDNQISDLKIQIEGGDQKATTIETSGAQSVEATITESVKVSGGPYISDGYFYVPKWGAKFKLSDDLTNYGYAVDQNHQGDSFGNYVVGLTAIAKSNYIEHPQATYYNDIFSCSVVTIRAMEDSKKDWWGNTSADIQFNGLNLVIHDTWRAQNCTNEYMAPTDAVAGQLKAILSKPEKI